MNTYVFYTQEGYAESPIGKSIENMQILGFAKGKNVSKALENLLKENSWIKASGFDKNSILVRQLLDDKLKSNIQKTVDYLWADEKNISKKIRVIITFLYPSKNSKKLSTDIILLCSPRSFATLEDDAPMRANEGMYFYFDIIQYSEDIENDLSHLNMKAFLPEIFKVAEESYRVLKKDKFCAVLMGDARKNGMVQPLAFETMTMFRLAGFKLKEIIIKEQHNCQATGYWKTNSVKYNFLLLAHEYLFIFKK